MVLPQHQRGTDLVRVRRLVVDAGNTGAVAALVIQDLLDDMRLHEELNIAPHVVEALLNHFSGHRSGSARPYNQAKYLPQMRQALAMWEDHIRALVEGGERKILPFEAAV